jgi:peptide/nickel transport system substrate-binding protein
VKFKDGKRVTTKLATIAVSSVLAASSIGCGMNSVSNQSQGGAGTTSDQSRRIGGTLTFVWAPNGPFVANFNPWAPANPVRAGILWVYEPLFYYNQYTGQTIPKLGTSFSYSHDHKSITVTLRPGVKWSDGVPFTSKDVVYTLNMLVSHHSIDVNDLGGMIQSVKAKGPYKVVINLKTVNNTAWYYIGDNTPIVPEHIWAKQNPVTFKDSNPVTTGPFLVQSVTSSLITFKRNPHYWNAPEPYVQQVRIPLYLDNNTAAMAMAQGKFDAASQFIPSIQSTLLSHSANYHDWFPPIGSVVLVTNDAAYPTSLTAFRQALSAAINRSQVARLGEFGYEPVSNSVALPSNLASQQYLDKSILAKHPLTYDPEKAKTILRKAGFTWNKAGKLVDPKGHPVSLTIDVASGVTDWIADAGVIASNLRAIGVDTQVKTLSGSTLNSLVANGNFQLTFGWVNQGPAYIGYNQLLNSKYTAPIGKQAMSNTERWSDKTTDQLLNEYPLIFSTAQQKAIMHKLENIFATNLPVIPLINGVAWDEYNTTNLVGWPTAQNPYGTFAGPIDQMYIFSQVHQK